MHKLSESTLASHLSASESAYLLELIHGCTMCSNREELDELVECIRDLVPYEFFTCLYASLEDGKVSETYHVMSTSYPSEWVKMYVENEFHRIDPILKEGLTSFRLQYWEDTYKNSPTDDEFRSAAEEFGLCSGYTTSVKNLLGNRCGLFSFSGRALEKDERIIAVLEALTPHLFTALDRVVYKEKLKELPALSVREKEVLKWVAFGKTTWETAAILFISERTVKFHINNIMKKLNAATRTHAASIASELGLIDLD